MLNWVRVSCLLAVGLLLTPALFAQAADVSFAQPADLGDALRLGVQACDTRCQTSETDCDLACDQVAACVEECKKVSAICAQQCRDAPPRVRKPESSATPIAPAGKKPPVGKAPAKAPPAKAPPAKAPPAKAPPAKAPPKPKAP